MRVTTLNYNKTLYSPKWYIIDATDWVLGRLATTIVDILRGKNKINFLASLDCGDFLIVTNVDKIILTGNKLATKRYYHHTGYTGGLKFVQAKTMFQNNPERMLLKAVKGMLPKNKLADKLIVKMSIYKGNDHPHHAQQPILYKSQSS